MNVTFWEFILHSFNVELYSDSILSVMPVSILVSLYNDWDRYINVGWGFNPIVNV